VLSSQIQSNEGRQEVLAPADEVDNLQAVAFTQVGSRPLIAGNDASVQLDGYAICFHLQLVHKTGESERRIEIPSFAIDLQFHIIWILAASACRRQVSCRASLDRAAGGAAPTRSSRLCFYFAQVEFAGCSAAGVVGLHEHGRIGERGFINIDLQLGVAV